MYLKILLMILILLQIILKSDAFFKSKIEQLRAKAKAVYKSKFTKNKEWQFLGYNPSEYAGSNKKYREDNQQKWDAYYECLKEQDKNLGAHGALTPEAILRFQGGTVKLDCRICLNPSERDNIDAVEWYFGKLTDKYLEQIFYSEHILLSPEENTLNLYNLQEMHSGQYVCVLGDSLTVPYYITVINGTRNVSEIHSEESKKGPHAKGPEIVEDHSMVLDSDWSEWSPCNKCNKVGRRYKIGYCTVQYDPNKPKNQKRIASKKIEKNATASSTNIFFNNIKQLFMNDSRHFDLDPKSNKSLFQKQGVEIVQEVHLELLKIFKYGIPCRSHILPDSIKQLKQVQARLDEVMIGFCKVKCSDAKIFEIRDSKGKILENANNSAGIYSMIQGLPAVEPEVERRLQYEKKGADIILICPGNLNSESPLLWQIDGKNVIAKVLYEQSNGRLHVSLLDRIHIKRSKVRDSAIYSCWQENELAGTVRLVVENRLNMNFNKHMMLAGGVAILSTFIIVFVRAFLGRKHAKVT